MTAFDTGLVPKEWALALEMALATRARIRNHGKRILKLLYSSWNVQDSGKDKEMDKEGYDGGVDLK